MTQPVFSNGWWWAQAQDGTWLRYDHLAGRWEPQSALVATAPAYAPYPQPYPTYSQPRTNGWAIASLVLGILWVCYIGSILAVIFGLVALREINRSPGTDQGRGLAIAGLTLGCIGVGLLVIALGASVGG